MNNQQQVFLIMTGRADVPRPLVFVDGHNHHYHHYHHNNMPMQYMPYDNGMGFFNTTVVSSSYQYDQSRYDAQIISDSITSIGSNLSDLIRAWNAASTSTPVENTSANAVENNTSQKEINKEKTSNSSGPETLNLSSEELDRIINERVEAEVEKRLKNSKPAEEKPVEKEKPKAEEKPVEKEKLVAEEKPIAEEKPVAEEKPIAEEKPVVQQTLVSSSSSGGIEGAKAAARAANAAFKTSHNAEDQRQSILAYNNWGQAILQDKNNATLYQIAECVASLDYICAPGNNTSSYVANAVSQVKNTLSQLKTLQAQKQSASYV